MRRGVEKCAASVVPATAVLAARAVLAVQTTRRTRSTSTTLHKEHTITQKGCAMSICSSSRAIDAIVKSLFLLPDDVASLGNAAFLLLLVQAWGEFSYEFFLWHGLSMAHVGSGRFIS